MSIIDFFTTILKKTQALRFQVEGTYENTYSLSLVNKSIARALKKHLFCKVKMYATAQHEAYMLEQKDIDRDILDMVNSPIKNIEVTIRNIYPPTTDGMQGLHKIIGPYGWEESKFPQEYVNSFNEDLTMILSMSDYVKNVLRNSGVKVPIVTTGVVVEDILQVKSDSFSFPLPDGSKLLHVSSCFPRKGADILLKAYDSLDTAQDISLIIKTFPNQHNEVLNHLADLGYTKKEQFEEDVTLYTKNNKKILYINKYIPQSQIRYLYENTDAIIAPSFGEGFGLPMAEAMLLELPVITTAFGGQSDFCTEENSWLIDFDFDFATSHVSSQNSLWQIPKENSLKKHIEQIFILPKNMIQQKTQKAKKDILTKYSSKQVANNIYRSINKPKSKRKSSIALFSTYNTRCGIALYSKYLISSFKKDVIIFANKTEDELIEKDLPNTYRCWNLRGGLPSISSLEEQLIKHHITEFIIQYNFSFLALEQLQELIKLCNLYEISTHLFIHSTKDVKDPTYIDSFSTITKALKKVTQIYVHTLDDMNYLKDFGIYKNTTLFSHGINTDIKKIENSIKNEIPILATFGFLLPQKGVFELIDVAQELHTRGIKVKLLLLTSIHPAQISSDLKEKLLQKIKNSPIKKYITLDTNYLEEQEIINRLSKTDKILFLYKNTQESSSAAVRMGLLAQKEIITTPSKIFDDVKSVVTQTKNDKISSIVETVINSLDRKFDNTKLKEFLDDNSWTTISSNFYNNIR